MKSIRVKYTANKLKYSQSVLKLFFLAFCVVLALYGIFYSWSHLAGHAKPETFTELYFEDHLHLPSTVISRHSYSFAFTLHNLESKDMEYSYEVSADIRQDKLLISFDKGTVFVKKDAYKTIREEFTPAKAFPRSEIVVYVINKKQMIDFWVEGGK